MRADIVCTKGADRIPQLWSKVSLLFAFTRSVNCPGIMMGMDGFQAQRALLLNALGEFLHHCLVLAVLHVCADHIFFTCTLCTAHGTMVMWAA